MNKIGVIEWWSIQSMRINTRAEGRYMLGCSEAVEGRTVSCGHGRFGEMLLTPLLAEVAFIT